MGASSSILFVIVLLAYFTTAQLRATEDGRLKRLIKNDFISREPLAKEIDLIPREPFSYGVETVGGLMTVFIPRNSMITPTKKSRLFTTTRDQQTNVTIQVFMGNWRLTKNCMLLGEFDLTGIPPAPRGTPRIEVTFVHDAVGTLFVKAEDKASGKSEKIKIIDGCSDPYSSRCKEIFQMLREATELEEKEERERIVGNSIMRNHIHGKDKLALKLEAEEKELMETSMSDNENAIAIAVDEVRIVQGDMVYRY